MPILIVGLRRRARMASGPLLRGSDVIVNEVAIVRGAPGATEGSAQVYLGRLLADARRLPGQRPGRRAAVGADQRRLLRRRSAPPLSLDVLQGDPARVRDLAVGFGSLRTIRAETPVAVPLVAGRPAARGRPAQGHGHERVRPALERPAVVLGQTVAVLDDLEPGAEATVDVAVAVRIQFGQSLSDKVVGQMFFDDGDRDAGHGPDVGSPLAWSTS